MPETVYTVLHLDVTLLHKGIGVLGFLRRFFFFSLVLLGFGVLFFLDPIWTAMNLLMIDDEHYLMKPTTPKYFAYLYLGTQSLLFDLAIQYR